MLAKKRLEGFRRILNKEKKRLEGELLGMQADNNAIDHMDFVGEGADDDLADAGSTTFDRERDNSLEENVKDILYQVNHAIAKLDKGNYGICEHCGDEIPDERLEALPYATLCIRCKIKQEKSP